VRRTAAGRSTPGRRSKGATSTEGFGYDFDRRAATMAIRALSPAEEMRVLVAVAVQPFVAAAVAFVAFPILLLDRDGQTLGGGRPADVVGAARSAALGVGLFALVVTLAAALPAAVWLMKRRRVRLAHAVVFGLAFGNLPYAIGALAGGAYGVTGLIRGVAFSSLLGASCAAVFWFVALRQPFDAEPDLAHPR
jgi:hypothetical protein